eukprot:3898925-Heterocapsa_arctica.AAC.1
MCTGCVLTPANVIWRDEQWDQAYEQCCAPADLWQNKGNKLILVSFRGKHRTREAKLRLRPECEQHGIGQNLQQSVKYLGGRVDAESSAQQEVPERLIKTRIAWAKFGRFWNIKNINRRARVTIFRAVVHSITLTGLESYTLSATQLQSLE